MSNHFVWAVTNPLESPRLIAPGFTFFHIHIKHNILKRHLVCAFHIIPNAHFPGRLAFRFNRADAIHRT